MRFLNKFLMAHLLALACGCGSSGGSAPSIPDSGSGTNTGNGASGGASGGDAIGGGQNQPTPTPGNDGGGGTMLAAEKRSITFTGSRGDVVPGYVWLPERPVGEKMPSIILMYGLGGDKDNKDIGAAAEELQKSGFISMTLDWPGTGDRGNISSSDRITKVDVLNWTVDDYEEALGFLMALPDVDSARVGYVGASMGAMTGIVFGSREQRLKAFVTLVPIPNPLWGADDPMTRIGQLGRPVLCIATSDNSDFSQNVCNVAPADAEKTTLPGGHELSGSHDEVVRLTKDFLERKLK